MNQTTGNVPTPEESAQWVEEMLARREVEQPGFRAAWEAGKASMDRKRDHAESAKREAREMIVAALRCIAADMLPADRKVFNICMDTPMLSRSLPSIAKDYKAALTARAKSIPPGSLVTGIEKIRDAAEVLKLALLTAPAEVLDEFDLAGLLVQSHPGRFGELCEFGHEAVAKELPREPRQSGAPWVRRLQGLESLCLWLAGELRQGKELQGKKTNYETRPESPDTKLFRNVLQVIREANQDEAHLRPIARVVRAFALGISYGAQDIQEPTWANREPSRILAEARKMNAAMVGIAQRIAYLEVQVDRRTCLHSMLRLILSRVRADRPVWKVVNTRKIFLCKP